MSEEITAKIAARIAELDKQIPEYEKQANLEMAARGAMLNEHLAALVHLREELKELIAEPVTDPQAPVPMLPGDDGVE